MFPEQHDYDWPDNYHLLLSPSSVSIHLRPYYNPLEWEPLETYLERESDDLSST